MVVRVVDRTLIAWAFALSASDSEGLKLRILRVLTQRHRSQLTGQQRTRPRPDVLRKARASLWHVEEAEPLRLVRKRRGHLVAQGAASSQRLCPSYLVFRVYSTLLTRIYWPLRAVKSLDRKAFVTYLLTYGR